MAQNPKCFKTALWEFCASLGIKNQGIFNFLSKSSMERENKTIKQYMEEKKIEFGCFLYCYILGTLFEYKFIDIEGDFAILRPVRVKSYEKPKTWEYYPHCNNDIRADINLDCRFNPNPTECLKNAISSLKSHIKSSMWQKDKAEKLLNC